MPVSNPSGHFGRTMQANVCNGCGRVLPKGSVMLLWSVWRRGFRNRVRLCRDCADIVYGCESRRPLDISDQLIIRDLCECCDSFPVCPKVQYLRESEPGELWFGGLEI